MKTKVCSEIEMVERARRDLDAFGELVEHYRSGIIRQCYGRVNDRHHAEDLAQETFIRAYLKLDQLRDPKLFSAWLRKIAANVCGEFARSSIRQELPWETLPEVSIAQETPGHLEEALSCLAVETRKCVELYYGPQMSYAEIAESMGVSESSVRNRLHRARAMLREELAEMTADTSPFTKRVIEKLEQMESLSPEDRARAAGDVRRSLAEDEYEWTLSVLRQNAKHWEEMPNLTEWEKSQDVSQAIKKSKKFRTPEMRDALVGILLHHEMEEIRLPAAGALVAQRDPAAIPFLQQALDDPFNPKEVIGACKSTISQLERMEQPPTPDFESFRLRRDFEDAAGDKTARLELMKRLVAALDDPSSKVRNEAIKALVELGDKRAAPAIVKLLVDEAPGVRQAAAGALGQLGSKKAVEGLMLGVQESDDRRLVQIAVMALGEIGDPAALPAVLEILESDEDWTLICQIAKNGVVARLATRETIPLVKEVVARLEERQPWVNVPVPYFPLESLFGSRREEFKLSHATPRSIYGVSLGLVADERDVEDLIRAYDEDAGNAFLADALRRIGDIRSLDVLKKHAMQGNGGAAHALVRLGKPGLEALKEIMWSHNAKAREAACNALYFDNAGGAELARTLNDEETIDILQLLAEADRSSSVRFKAKAALLKITRPEAWTRSG